MFSLKVDEQIARITIDRGGKRNAVPMDDWCKLEGVVRAANLSKAIVVTIESADPNSFCAGSDLSELEKLRDEPLMRRRFRGAMESVVARIRALNKPSVALVSGGCFGTGVSLAAACDMRIARSDASFALRPARFGISYPKPDVERIIQLTGPGSAARLILASRIQILGKSNAQRMRDKAAIASSSVVPHISTQPASAAVTLKTILDPRRRQFIPSKILGNMFTMLVSLKSRQKLFGSMYVSAKQG